MNAPSPLCFTLQQCKHQWVRVWCRYFANTFNWWTHQLHATTWTVSHNCNECTHIYELHCWILEYSHEQMSVYQQWPRQTDRHPFSGLFSRTTWVSPQPRIREVKPILILMKQEMMRGSGISWTIYKSSVPCSGQITTPAHHHSIFAGQVLFLTLNQQCQTTDGNYQQWWR